MDTLSEHSHYLLLAVEDLVASLYSPQDPSVIQRAIESIDGRFQGFKKTLFADIFTSSDRPSETLEEKMSKVAVDDTPLELPHGYETSYRVLATCVSKASEPPRVE